jgi:hypothetical protein
VASQRAALGVDHVHQLVPRLHKRGGAFFLQPPGQRRNVDASRRKASQRRLRAAADGGEQLGNFAVIGEIEQGGLRHRVDRERRLECFHVEHVGRVGILGTRASPEQALGPGAGIGESPVAWRIDQLAIRLVRLLRDGGDLSRPRPGLHRWGATPRHIELKRCRA